MKIVVIILVAVIFILLGYLHYQEIQLTQSNMDITHYEKVIYGYRSEKPRYINKCFINRTDTIVSEFKEDKPNTGYDIQNYVRIQVNEKIYFYKTRQSWIRYGYINGSRYNEDRYLETKCPRQNEIIE